MKVLINAERIFVSQCEFRSDWAFEWEIYENYRGPNVFDFETKDNKRAIATFLEKISYWEVVLEP